MCLYTSEPDGLEGWVHLMLVSLEIGWRDCIVFTPNSIPGVHKLKVTAGRIGPYKVGRGPHSFVDGIWSWGGRVKELGGRSLCTPALYVIIINFSTNHTLFCTINPCLCIPWRNLEIGLFGLGYYNDLEPNPGYPILSNRVKEGLELERIIFGARIDSFIRLDNYLFFLILFVQIF
jgi:hypothetical protein